LLYSSWPATAANTALTWMAVTLLMAHLLSGCLTARNRSRKFAGFRCAVFSKRAPRGCHGVSGYESSFGSCCDGHALVQRPHRSLVQGVRFPYFFKSLTKAKAPIVNIASRRILPMAGYGLVGLSGDTFRHARRKIPIPNNKSSTTCSGVSIALTPWRFVAL